MSRYSNRIPVRDPNLFTGEIAAFLQSQGYKLGQRNNETVWWRDGFNCIEYIIINYDYGTVIVTAFIVTIDVIEYEMGIKGFMGAVPKAKLKKVVEALEAMIRAKGV